MIIRFIYFLLLSVCLFSSCKKTDESAPHITTSVPNQVASYTATSGGTSIDNGPVLEKGVCWSNARIPDVTDNKVSGGTGEGNFSAVLTGLEPSMTYYVRAYARNKYRTGYGNVVKFTTNVGPTLPSLLTYYPSSVTQTAATFLAQLQNITNSPITSIGFCWSTHSKPPIKDNITTATIPVAGYSYSAGVTGLQANTAYYLRAYAINGDGTSYGNEASFKTTYGTVTDYNGNVYGTVIIGGKEWMAENLRVNRFNDGTSIPFVNDNTSWGNLTTPGYCNYNNASVTAPLYGKLYNFYCVNYTKNIAPLGWHVSTTADWYDLQAALGQDSSGAKIKVTGSQYWNYGYGSAGTNESGFSAIGAGNCDYYQYFSQETYDAYFWIKGSSPYCMQATYSTTYLYQNSFNSNSGSSIRCVRD